MQRLPHVPTIHLVTEDCNMIEFAKKCVKNYDPDSGKGYYQLIDGDGECISRHMDVILISEVCVQYIVIKSNNVVA